MEDPYIYEDGTLKNKLNIKDYNELKEAEKNIIFTKLISIEDVEIGENNLETFKNIHKYMFEDIFDWAGEFRTVPIYKEEVVIPMLSLNYAMPNEIDGQIDNFFSELEQIDWNKIDNEEKSITFTKELAKLWRIHPFRDGNTRTTIAFATIFAKEHGFKLDLGSMLDSLVRKYDENEKIIQFSLRDKFVLAALDEKDYPEPEHLNKIIKAAIVDKELKEIEER